MAGPPALGGLEVQSSCLHGSGAATPSLGGMPCSPLRLPLLREAEGAAPGILERESHALPGNQTEGSASMLVGERGFLLLLT